MKTTGTPSIELRHLRLVSAIASSGSVTAAAKELDLTQPAVSHQLRELETKLRTPLFVRTARGMVPTPAGERLIAIAKPTIGQVEEYERQVHAGDFEQAIGSVRLATECYTAYHWLPPVLRAFRERWPQVDLRISPEHTMATFTALREGSLDLAIVHSKRSDKRLAFDTLFEDELVVVMSPRHRLARKQFVSAQDFASEHLIEYSTWSGTTELEKQILEPAGIAPARVTKIQLTEAIFELVAADLGIAVMSRWSTSPWVRSGGLTTVRLTERGWPRRWWVARRAHDLEHEYQRDLIELLRRNLAGGPAVRSTQRMA